MGDEWVYRAEYSLSDRAACKKCQSSIAKNVVRLCIMQQSRFHDGKDALWHHPACFFKKKPTVKVDEIWHFHDLRWKDQLRIRQLAAGKTAAQEDDDEEEMVDLDEEVDMKGNGKRSKKQGSNGTKKKKANTITEGDGRTEALRVQNDIIWACRDHLATLPVKAMKAILEENDQHVPVSGKMLDRLTDVVVFGATEKCTVCASPTGHVVISADGYRCLGSLTEWAKCDFKTQTPARRPPTFPPDLLKTYPFLKEYVDWTPKERLFPACFQWDSDTNGKHAATAAQKGRSVTDTPSTVVDSPPSTSDAKPSVLKKHSQKVAKFSKKKPLTGLTIAAAGTLSLKRRHMANMLTALGGQYVPKPSKDTFVVISDSKAIAARPVALEMAEVCAVHVVPVEFIAECQEGKLKTRQHLVDLVEGMKINPWTATAASLLQKMQPKVTLPDLTSALSSTEEHRAAEQLRNKRLVASTAGPAKMLVKNGGVLDADCQLDEKRHSVYRDSTCLYSCTLARTNISDGTNAFYKMQIIQRDGKDVFHLFRSWGRIGTVIGGSLCHEMEKDDAVHTFEFHFMEKTGNQWKERHAFVKKPFKYFVMELDYGPEEEPEVQEFVKPGSKTKLAKPIQDIIRMIFDVEEMRKTMKMFEMDMRKMPLGKLSRKQILAAMSVLGEVEGMVENGERPNSPRIIGASNRFFTLIPHHFGIQTPPILNELSLIKDKLEMLENLLEMEVAFEILRSEKKNSDEDPLDQHYEKLKCDMEVIGENSKELKEISEYVEKTHAATHTAYRLKVIDVFRVVRHGEAERFDKFKNLPNHKLLWHGSRTTNYAGILSQGLRIAPPEAPVTGYMFGKGVYFADMVTKSANYCFTDPSNPLGLLLLSDVALGNMHELTEAKSISRLPVGFHSVKGCGQTLPDPTESVILPDGVEIPLGHSTPSGVKKTSLLYNEYIVYDEAQINLRYLVKVEFDYAGS